MNGSLLGALDLAELRPARLWAGLAVETRLEAARALYAETGEERSAAHSADAAVARAMKFRESSVRRLPADKKAGYLARLVHPDDVLAAALLQALHLAARRPLLAAFLDALGIPHQDGVISAEAKVEPPSRERLAEAVGKVAASFPAEPVDLYLASLLAVDRETWGALTPILEERRGT